MSVLMMGFDPPVSKTYFHWIKGMEKVGDAYKILHNPVTDYSPMDDADCYYQTNMLKPKFFAKNRSGTQGNHYQYILNSKKPFIVSESNPFRKYEGWVRFGWWSYKWSDANCNNKNVGDERWKKFQSATNIKIKDWHSPGDNILIMGQKEGDSSLTTLYQKFDNFYDWVLDVISTVRKYSDRPIVVRPHPKNEFRNIGRIKEEILCKNLTNVHLSEHRSKGGNQGGESLDKELSQSHCVITYNSLSGVEAVCAGIPTFALENGSMVWPISQKDLSTIENLNYSIDIQDWKNKIAYTIWNKEEVLSGECWRHLKPVFFKD